MIHRDVKGDNYLTDRKDITDEECRVVLTDFGTGLEIEPNQRLKESCGTTLYWSPEFYKLDYSLPVDIFAMGVLVYGLLCGRFPFKSKKEASTKVVKFSDDVPAECQDMCNQLLEKEEAKRITAEKVLEHEMVKQYASMTEHTPNAMENGDTFGEGAMREFGADHGIQDRRLELVDRLLQSEQKQSSDHIWKDSFAIKGKAGKGEILYEWWTEEHVDHDVLGSIPDGGTATKLEDSKPMDEDKTEKAAIALLKKQLEDHDIDTTPFGKGEAKTLEKLSEEVQSGTTVLMLDATKHKTLVRVVDVVAVRICVPGKPYSVLRDSSCCCRDSKDSDEPGTADRYLVETHEVFGDGRTASRLKRLPASKKFPYENTKQTAERVAKEIDLGAHEVVFEFEKTEIFQHEEDSPSYPGVDTVYRMEIVEAKMVSTSASTSDEFTRKEKNGNTMTYKWMESTECAKEKIRLHKDDDEDNISALVQAPVGMNEDDLKIYLTEHKVDLSQFGKGKAKTLKDISDELTKGESSLMVDSDGSIIRYVDVVLLKLKNAKNNKILIQTERVYEDGSKQSLKRLPATDKRPDENLFFSAKHIVTRKLHVSDNHVAFSTTDVHCVEEEKQSLAYPGLRTVYRKRIVNAMLNK
jgi:hypothetical protein